MCKKIILMIQIILLLGSVSVPNVFATIKNDQSIMNVSSVNQEDETNSSLTINNMGVSKSKSQSAYKGTENTDESQVSFFIIPSIVIGLSLMFLLFNRKK